jgi:hypothetical protein
MRNAISSESGQEGGGVEDANGWCWDKKTTTTKHSCAFCVCVLLLTVVLPVVGEAEEQLQAAPGRLDDELVERDEEALVVHAGRRLQGAVALPPLVLKRAKKEEKEKNNKDGTKLVTVWLVARRRHRLPQGGVGAWTTLRG